MPTFRATSDGIVAIFNGADDVYYNPYADLSRVLFHSSLLYPQIIETHTGYLYFPVLTENQSRRQVHTLFYHGKAGVPLIFGLLLGINYGYDLPLQGSVPVYMDQYGFARYVTLGANNAQVMLHEDALAKDDSYIPEQTIYWKVFVTNFILE
jgi:hypothetical protein